jgi:transposase InsO family protein
MRITDGQGGTTHIATRAGEVWCWDVTFLLAQIQGRWFYFYMILDLYSRKIVGFERSFRADRKPALSIELATQRLAAPPLDRSRRMPLSDSCPVSVWVKARLSY